jgi:uncharacterized protein YlzI (FlbEa/FlbD family)
MKQYMVYKTKPMLDKSGEFSGELDVIYEDHKKWINPKHIESANYPGLISVYKLNGKPFKTVYIHMTSGGTFLVSEKDFKEMNR